MKVDKIRFFDRQDTLQIHISFSILVPADLKLTAEYTGNLLFINV